MKKFLPMVIIMLVAFFVTFWLMSSRLQRFNKKGGVYPPTQTQTTTDRTRVPKTMAAPETRSSNGRSDSTKLSADRRAEPEGIEDLATPEFYAIPWERNLADYEKIMDVKITEIPEPTQYKLQLKPIQGKRYRYISVTTATFASAQNPFMRMAHDTRIVTKLNDKGQLVIDIQQERPWALVPGQPMPVSPKKGEACQFVVRNGDLYEMQAGDLGPKETSTSLASGDIQNHVFNFPKKLDIRLGSSWTEERQGAMPSKTTYRLTGFANVDGIKTAKIVSNETISMNADAWAKIMNPAFKSMASEISQISKTHRSAAEAEQMLRSHASKNLAGQGLVQKGITYVDIETGLVVRREMSVITGSGPFETTTKEISQSKAF